MASHLIGKAALFAMERHGEQKYGSRPFHVHLCDVAQVLRRFFDWEALPQEFIDAAWLHDVIEDTSTSRLLIDEMFGGRVGELVYAVTDEPGANRKERKIKTYPKIRATPNAITIKLADRIANMEQTVSHDRLGRPPQKLFWMYLSEWPSFQSELRGRCAGEGAVEAMMWTYLDEIIQEGERKANAYRNQKSFGGEV